MGRIAVGSRHDSTNISDPERIYCGKLLRTDNLISIGALCFVGGIAGILLALFFQLTTYPQNVIIVAVIEALMAASIFTIAYSLYLERT
jgi:hypothetical protein